MSGDSLMSPAPPTIGLMNQPEGVVIDASLRFARSNPDLVRFAHENAGAGASVDDLLREAIERVVASRAQSHPAFTGEVPHAITAS